MRKIKFHDREKEYKAVLKAVSEVSLKDVCVQNRRDRNGAEKVEGVRKRDKHRRAQLCSAL